MAHLWTRSPQQATGENVVGGPLAAPCRLESDYGYTQDHSAGIEPRQTDSAYGVLASEAMGVGRRAWADWAYLSGVYVYKL